MCEYTVYAGGYFTEVHGLRLNHLVALDATSGAPADWNPEASDAVLALAVSGSTVYAGGSFTTISWLPRAHVAAFVDATTLSLISLVGSQAAPDRVQLTWHAANSEGLVATVYRRTVHDDWAALGQVRADRTGHMVHEDRHVIAGNRYRYRLGVWRGDREVFLGETWVDVPATAAFALAGFRPNPAMDDLRIAFSLLDASPARLEVFDVAGRVLPAREVGALGPGNHVVTLGDGRTLTPGIYLLRLSQASRSLTVRAAALR